MVGEREKINLSYCRAILIKSLDGKTLDGGIEYIKGMSNDVISRDMYLEFEHLETGTYYLYVDMDWDLTTKDFRYCATSYGQAEIKFEINKYDVYD